MPTFTKEVWNAATNSWTHSAQGFTGDTLRFRLTYTGAADVDAKAIIIRDFLPRGMHYVPASANHAAQGNFTSTDTCTSTPGTPQVASFGDLEFLQWDLCTVEQASTWQVTIDATIGDMPSIQPNWIVANFGKLSGQNTQQENYSLRDIASIDYAAPELELTKEASPNYSLKTGDTTTFTITIRNNGRAPAYNINVIDTLPANLLVANSGGSASPAASSYTTTSGSPSAGSGGVLTWSTVASLAAGASQSFTFQATIPTVVAGTSMTNLASVSYTSRADNAGHRWNTTSNIADTNTDTATVYTHSLTITKSASPSYATIGDTVRWTLTGSVPAGVIAYWPTVQENSLPDGYVYIPGTTTINGASLDIQNHSQNPLNTTNGSEIRWFLQTIDNRNSQQTATFTIVFDTLITGLKPGNPPSNAYTNNCCLATSTNTAYIGWYNTPSGYNSTNFAYDGFETNRTTYRSPKANADVTIIQPNLVVSVAAERTNVGANEEIQLRLEAVNIGNSIAHDITLNSLLPEGVTLVRTNSVAVAYPTDVPYVTTHVTNNNQAGTRSLTYGLDTLYVGVAFVIKVTVKVDNTIAAGLELPINTTASYTSKAGVKPDTNNDGAADERRYTTTPSVLSLRTPSATIEKRIISNGELTYGAQIVYAIAVPASPINATTYDVAISDIIDSHLEIISVGGGSVNGNTVTANVGSIPPWQQHYITISAVLPDDSVACDGEFINNQAQFSYRGHAVELSNIVSSKVVAPGLEISLRTNTPSASQGDTVTFNATVSNVGYGIAQQLALGISLPSSIQFVPGSVRFNGQPLNDPVDNMLSLPNIGGRSSGEVTFQGKVLSSEDGEIHTTTVKVTGRDSIGREIPANNHERVCADENPTDTAKTNIYGPLSWDQDSVSIAFEDLKKSGWNDWDYNDLVVKMDFKKGLSDDGALVTLEITYKAMARGAGYDHRFLHKLPIFGGGNAETIQYNSAGQEESRRYETFGSRPTFVIFEHTKKTLEPFVSSYTSNTEPQQPSFINGASVKILMTLDQPQENYLEDMPPMPWDAYIYVYESGQEIHRVMPGQLDNTQTVNNMYDAGVALRGYDLPLAQVFSGNWKWPIEYGGIWRAYPSFVNYIQTGGTESADWSADAKSDSTGIWGKAPAALRSTREQVVSSAYFEGPTAADINGDGKLELAVGNLLANRVEVYDSNRTMLPGWPQSTGGGVKASPALANLVGDANLEVIAGAEDGKLYAWSSNGVALPGWPVQVTNARILAKPAIADLNKDGSPDVVVPAANGKIYAFNANGTPLTGWPVNIGGIEDINNSQIINSSPRIADLDGSGNLKVVVGSTDGKLYVINSRGRVMWSYATEDMIFGAAAIADFVPSRAGQEIAVASGDSYVYLLGNEGTLLFRKATGWTIRSTPLAADLNGDNVPEIVVSADDHKVYAWFSDGSLVAGWPQTTGAPVFASPTAADLNGDGKVEIVVGSDDGKVYAWDAGGTTVSGWPKDVGVAVKGTPVVAALEPGETPQIVITNVSGSLSTLEQTVHIYIPLLQKK